MGEFILKVRSALAESVRINPASFRLGLGFPCIQKLSERVLNKII
jgi:hypothetical protein